MVRKLEAVDDVQQVRAVGHDQDVDGQREASEEGEEEFHRLGVQRVSKRNEAIFKGVDRVEQVNLLVVGKMAGNREFNAGVVETINLSAEEEQVGFSNHWWKTSTLPD